MVKKTGHSLRSVSTYGRKSGHWVSLYAINNQFNDMLKTIKHLNKQVFLTTSQLYEAQLSKEKIDLQYLRSQINPHFLYNTLESLKGLAAAFGNKEIVKFTKALSSIFKYSLKGEAEVPLSEELKIIKNYIYSIFVLQTGFAWSFMLRKSFLTAGFPRWFYSHW